MIQRDLKIMFEPSIDIVVVQNDMKQNLILKQFGITNLCLIQALNYITQIA
jgi:hypothetical protein